MNYRVTHITTYSYQTVVTLCHNELRMSPTNNSHQRIIHQEVTISPPPSARSERVDFFGNIVTHFTIEEPHESMVVTVTTELEKKEPAPQKRDLSLPWDQCRQVLADVHTDAHLDACQYIYSSQLISPSQIIKDYAEPSFIPGRPILEVAHDLMNRIFNDFTYTSGSTTIATPLEEVMRTRKGVCQDFAQIAIGCFRAMDLPARYVSGYLETIPPAGEPRLIGADASHAWFSVYDPESHWHDFDPTNNMSPEKGHITVGWGRDFYDLSPLKGFMVGGTGQKMQVSVDVAPLSSQSQSQSQ